MAGEPSGTDFTPNHAASGSLSGSSPASRFTERINRWHRDSLASMRLTVYDIRQMADAAGLLLDIEPQDRPAGLGGVPVNDGTRCSRCNRKLQYAHMVNGEPFGSVCVRKQGDE